MITASYQIQIEDLFSGPADLLLYLVRKHEVDVSRISLSGVVDQFQEYLNVLELINFDFAADFVVTAAALIEMKSRLALVRDEQSEDEEEEADEAITNQNLIQHLLEYRKLQEAAELLQEQALAWNDRYPRLADDRPSLKRSLADDIIRDLEVWDLVGAFARIVKTKATESETLLRFDTTPIHVYVDQIGKQVREHGRIRFQNLFEQMDDRSKIIGMFLAVLELVRHHQFRAQQAQDFNEIWILPPLENQDDDYEDDQQHVH